MLAGYIDRKVNVPFELILKESFGIPFDQSQAS